MQTILIVDDSPMMRRMVRAALTGLSDIRLVEAGSGLQAIEILALEPVHTMVLDLNMADMHGLDVLGFLQSHPRHRGLPVLVLTTRGDDTSRGAAMAAGASLYLTKPFSPAVLAASVRQLLDASPVSRSHG